MSVAAGVDPMALDLWGEVLGQDRAVAQLRAGAANPVHAYLFVGPEGCGKLALARAFAAELLADGLDDAGALRARRLAASDEHPSLLHFRPAGAEFSVADAEAVVRAASRTPPEGRRQVMVLHDLQRAHRDAFPRMLKAIEEPAAGTFYVVLATHVPAEMSTISSRCVQLDLDAIPVPLLERRLVDEGVDAAAARVAAAASGGSLSRARLLANDPEVGNRRDLWRSTPLRLDGTGATAAQVCDELLASLDVVLEPLTARHASELESFHAGYEARGETAPKGRTKELTDRHKREVRRVRLDELRAGLAAIVEPYRTRVTDGGDPSEFLEVADRVQRLCDALEFNPNEPLQLRALLLALPPLK